MWNRSHKILAVIEDLILPAHGGILQGSAEATAATAVATSSI